jgi:hypothetical protein
MVGRTNDKQQPHGSLMYNQSNPTKQSPSSNPDESNVAGAVTRGEFVLSLSTMLGCDYIFVNHKGMHELLQPGQASKTIRELLDMLDTSPHQSMIIGADDTREGPLSFTRYEYAWENRQVTKVSIMPVTHGEQIEFMQMMFDCSTAFC